MPGRGRRTARSKAHVALVSVGAAVGLTAFKLLVGMTTHSLGILSEALHSGLDLVAALITFFAVRISDRPADEDHPYGHGKVENVSALVETVILLATCVWIVVEAWNRLRGQGPELEITPWAFAVMGTSIAVDFWRSRTLAAAARQFGSQALEADALHFSSDILSSAVVIVGLGASLTGFPWADAGAALLVAALVALLGVRLGRRALDALVDRVSPELRDRVGEVVRNSGLVEQVKHLRLRAVGSRVFIDMTVGIDRALSFDEAHAVTEEIEGRLRRAVPQGDVVVHAEPARRSEEGVVDFIHAGTQHYRAGVHDLEILEDRGGLWVQFHMEFRDRVEFVEAHERADRFERELRRAYPAVNGVTIHLDRVGLLEHAEKAGGRGAEGIRAEDVARVVAAVDGVEGVHGIRIVEATHGANVSLHCVFPDESSLQWVHETVHRIEETVHARLQGIARVLAHAEPLSASDTCPESPGRPLGTSAA